MIRDNLYHVSFTAPEFQEVLGTMENELDVLGSSKENAIYRATIENAISALQVADRKHECVDECELCYQGNCEHSCHAKEVAAV